MAASSGAFPNLIIIGAQKCATTSLHRYLDLHPAIGMSRDKELNFFAAHLNWDRGEAWYRSWFDPAKPVRGETSPGYTNFPLIQGVPERMHRLVPDARLIFLVRDPVERMLSHYRHMVAEGKEHRPALEALSDPNEPYTRRGLYHYQLEQYLPHYDIRQILVVQQEALLASRAETLARIFTWLGVDASFRSIGFRHRKHRTSRKRLLTARGTRLAQSAPMRAVARLPDPWRWMAEDAMYWPFSRAVPRVDVDSHVRARLDDRFREDAAKLRRLTGLALEGWSV